MAARQSFNKKLQESLTVPFYMVAVLWIIHLIQFILPFNFGWLGIYPGEIWGLRGVIFAPLIHSDWGHLLSNTPPFFALTAIIWFFYRRIAIPSFMMIYLLTGLGVWLFGREVFHIGASGVVYGLVSFVFWNGIFRRNLKSIVLALIVVFYYGSMFAGILPGQEGISWESHLIGGIVGIFASYWFKEAIEEDEKKPVYSWELEEETKESFLDPNAFEKTRQQRMEEQRRRDEDGWFRTIS
ncbi:MAG: rhomboid family intramembrane serine protease [Bacteroidota bacterium]